MNYYWLIGGIIILITGFVHAFLGEKWIFSRLNTTNLGTHYSGEVTKTTLRWFWHFGSFMVFLIGALTLTMALTEDVIPAEAFLGKLLAFIYLGLNTLLILFNLNKPSNLKEYPQLLIMIAIMILLWLGAG